MNVLQAALATQALAQNPGLQPLLMAQAAAGGAPWLSPALAHLGLISPGAALGAAAAAAGALPNGGLTPTPLPVPTPAGLAGALGAPSPVPPGVGGAGAPPPMLDAALAAQLGAGGLPLDPQALLFHGHPAAGHPDWGVPRGPGAGPGPAAAAAGLGMGPWVQDPLAVAAAARQSRGAYANGGSL